MAIAVEKGNLEIVKMLLASKEIDVNTQSILNNNSLCDLNRLFKLYLHFTFEMKFDKKFLFI